MSMEKEVMNRIFLVLVLGMFLLSMIGFVSAQESSGSYVGNVVEKTKDIFGSLFTASGWDTLAENTANTAKIIFFIMITIVLYLLISSIIKDKAGLIIILSAAISFLFTAYIAPAEIYSMLASYTAAGMAIITLIPLGILALFTYKAANDGNVAGIMLQWIAWGLYAVYLFYRIILDYFFLKEGAFWTNGIVLAVGLIAAGMFLFNKTIIKFVMKKYSETEIVVAQRNIKKAAETIKLLSEAGKEIAKN